MCIRDRFIDIPSFTNEINPDVMPENDPADDSQNSQEEASDNLEQYGELMLPKLVSDVHVITVIGQIEGHLVMPSQNKATKYEHVIPQLVAVEQSPDIKGLMVILNTVGGDVEAGLAIAEIIASMTKPTVSLVLGGGHSIGVPIAVAADRSFISSTATMTIHPIRLTGMVVGVQQSFDYLEKMQDLSLIHISFGQDNPSAKPNSLVAHMEQIPQTLEAAFAGKQIQPILTCQA